MLQAQRWCCSSTATSSRQPWRSGCSVPCHSIAWNCSRPACAYRRCYAVSAAATPPPERQSGDKPTANAAALRRSRSQQPQHSSGASSGGPRSAGTPSSNGNANSSDSSSSSNSSRRGRDAAAGGRSSSNNGKSDNTAIAAGTSSRAVAGRSSRHVSSTGNTQQPRGQKQRRVQAASSQPQLVNDRQLTTLIKEQANLAGIQGLLKRHRKLVNVIHINAALKWLLDHPQQQPHSSQELAAIVQQLVKGVTLEQPPARNCASIAYYCSKLGYVEDLGLYRAVLQRFMVVKQGANPQAVSNLLYALGSQQELQGLLDQNVLVELLQQMEIGGDATTQAISNALWAAAKCEPGDSPQLGEVVAQLLGRFLGALDKTTPQAVSNTLYALAALPRAWPMGSVPCSWWSAWCSCYHRHNHSTCQMCCGRLGVSWSMAGWWPCLSSPAHGCRQQLMPSCQLCQPAAKGSSPRKCPTAYGVWRCCKPRWTGAGWGSCWGK